jgi:hypothetical protein
MALTDEDKIWIAARLDSAIDRLDASTARIANYMLEMRTEITRRLDSLDQRLEFLGSAVSTMDSRFLLSPRRYSTSEF